MIPKGRIGSLAIMPSALDTEDAPTRLIDVEVEDVTFYMPDGVTSYRLKAGDTLEPLTHDFALTISGERHVVFGRHVYRLSRVTRTIKMLENPYVPPAAQ